MHTLKSDLLASGMELRETHISWVFLSADTVYKVKKPVALGFLDFSTLEARKHFCEQELALNRRLAPDVYRSVVPITRAADGGHRIGGAGEPVDWAVEMRRLPDRDNAQSLLDEGRLDRDAVTRLARHLAAFHASTRCDDETSSYGTVAAIAANVRENFEQTRTSATRFLAAPELAALERWQLGFISEQHARFEDRIAKRRVRDGHGDLRLEHCYLNAAGEVAVIDCIEFNERFRYGDVCADIAFLAMDLVWHERPDLSEAFLAAYAQASDDYDLYGVVDFYESYRAFVRGKISSMLEADTSLDTQLRAQSAAQARKYYLLAEACTREPLEQPTLYAVGGIIASGKSSVAAGLGLLLEAPVLEADRTRKRMLGLPDTAPLHDPAFSGHYSPGKTREVYAELLRRAALVLQSRRSVIMDASFRDRDQRAAALELARSLGAAFLFIECVVNSEVCKGRLELRARGASVSDGRVELLDAFIASYQAVGELASAQHLQVDTTQPIADTLAQLRAKLAAPAASLCDPTAVDCDRLPRDER